MVILDGLTNHVVLLIPQQTGMPLLVSQFNAAVILKLRFFLSLDELGNPCKEAANITLPLSKVTGYVRTVILPCFFLISAARKTLLRELNKKLSFNLRLSFLKNGNDGGKDVTLIAVIAPAASNAHGTHNLGESCLFISPSVCSAG